MRPNEVSFLRLCALLAILTAVALFALGQLLPGL